MLERIYVEIGNVCNLNCTFCQGTSRPKRQMSEGEFAAVCEKIREYTRYIYLHVLGEPLLHPRLDSLLKIAQSSGLSACITTNGTLLPQKGEIILENHPAVHKVSVSLHSAEGSGVEDYKGYLDAAVKFAKQAAEKGIYVVFRLWNMDSAEGLGKNSQNSSIEAFLKENFKGDWQQRPKGFRLDKNIFLEYDGLFTWPSQSKATQQEQGFCYGLSGQLAILADGTVVPCCLDCDGEITLGNIFKTPLKEILEGDRAKAIKNGFASGKIVEPLCKRCTFARKFKKRNN